MFLLFCAGLPYNNRAGDYQLCFDNSFSYQHRKIVFFEIFLYDKDGNLDELEYGKMAFGTAPSKELEALGMEAEKVKVCLV